MSRAEREQFRGLRLPEPRQLEWLAARTAAKEAVRALVRRVYGLETRHADIEIATDAHGRTAAHGPWLGWLDALPLVALAHAAGWGVAVAGLERRPAERVGIAVEALGDRSPAGLDAAEAALLSGLPTERRAEWLLRCWCARAAVARGLGFNLQDDPTSIEAVAIDAARGIVLVQLAGALAQQYPDVAGASLRAYTDRHQHLVVATTTCDADESAATQRLAHLAGLVASRQSPDLEEQHG